MLPEPIRSYVDNLNGETVRGSMQWYYNDDNASVTTTLKNSSSVTVEYKFDINNELGMFILSIDSSKFYKFNVNELEVGYNNLKMLYDNAQASDFSKNFGKFE